MIASYEEKTAPAFEAYGLNFDHKHIPEIMAYGGLNKRPIFTPSVGNFAKGMLVFIPLFLDELPAKPQPTDLHQALAAHYGQTRFVKVLQMDETGRLEPESLNGTNILELRVFANMRDQQAILAAKLDNLGKGASGAALQNIDLMLGLRPNGHQA
jgi:N-acetyl-gamma-glutamyl-phosphate reductase